MRSYTPISMKLKLVSSCVRDENSLRRFTVRRDIDVINENLTLNARRCEASITTSGNDRTRCRLRICNIKCYMPHMHCVYISSAIFAGYARARNQLAAAIATADATRRAAPHLAAPRRTSPFRFVLCLPRIKIPDKGIGGNGNGLAKRAAKSCKLLR